MKRITLGLLGVLALGIGAWQSFGQQQDLAASAKLKPVMQLKLAHSKAVFESLALEDFPTMAKNAQALSLLSLESSWNTITTQEYIEQSSDFRRACQVIQEAAEEKNVDRAALGFVNLTVRCVECHKYLRKNGLIVKRDLSTSPK